MFSFNAVARAISVILGDEWRSLSSEARKVYIMEAKTLAEEHKRIYPDCWKRKRTQVSKKSIEKMPFVYQASKPLVYFANYSTFLDVLKRQQKALVRKVDEMYVYINSTIPTPTIASIFGFSNDKLRTSS